MQLLLLRHAKSDWSTGEPDHERPLSKRGQHDARRMGEWFARNAMPPTLVICSTARRARQTLELFNQTADIPGSIIHSSPRLYHAGLQPLLALIGEHRQQSSLMLVGHNPGLDQLLVHLVDAPLPRTKKGKLMTTATLAVLELDTPTGTESPASAKLVQLVRPKDLD